jgi:hypothetical protein
VNIRALLRKASGSAPIPLQPLVADFVRITQELFSFLVTEWGCQTEVSGAGSGEITVLFRNRNVGVEVTLVGEIWVIPMIVPLRNGRMPPWFDWKLRDQFHGFAPEQFFETVDPTWRRPEHRQIERSEDIERELRPYAEELHTLGQPLRVGDRAVFAQMEAQSRRGLIRIYVKNWATFVERVRVGFDGPITQYVAGIVERSQLDAVIQTWKGDRLDDPLEEIGRLDRLFDQATEPLAWGKGRNIVVPSPGARRWWRRPKWLTGSLRDYFLIHGKEKKG